MANTWWELKILCEPDLEDIIFWRLEYFGCRGTASENKGNSALVRAYLPRFQVQLLRFSCTFVMVTSRCFMCRFTYSKSTLVFD